jgi:glycerol-3-phosphate acyltransferase PlsY
VLLGFFPLLTLPGLAAGLAWAAVMLIDRRVGLASVVAALCLPVFVVLEAVIVGLEATDALPLVAVTGLLAALVLVRHRGNLARIWAGTEPRVGKG